MPLAKMVDLSTRHVPDPGLGKPDFGMLRTAEHQHGWIVFVDTTGLPSPMCPVWLWPILQMAQNEECILINFDCDGPTDDTFETYYW